MNGAHDMGGTHGFGPVVPEADEPWFHADWERRVFAMVIAAGAGGKWNIDAGRFAREDRPPAEYLDKSYFELWLAGLERLLAGEARGVDVPFAGGTERDRQREDPPLPVRVERGLVDLGDDRAEAVRAVHGAVASPVPIIESRVTSVASCSSLQSSVPPGRIGTTR